MSEDVLANFSCLDELTQVIYQGFYKFVVLSNVSDDKWIVHVGLSGNEGRWWSGCWKEEDIHRIFGSKSSDKLLESFAEKLAEVFVQGEICISDWSAEKGANIKFTLGPTSKKTMHIPLVEMSSEEAAAYATSVFLDIALQAQSRKCKLYPSSTEYTGLSSTSYTPAIRLPEKPAEVPAKRKELSPEPPEAGSSSVHKSNVVPSAKDIMKQRAAEQEAKKAQAKDTTRRRSPAEKPVAPVPRIKGASLANPSKKARKFQAIEFESDDE